MFLEAIFTTIFAFLSAFLGILALPMLLMVICNLVDYITGLLASPYRKEDINSYKSIRCRSVASEGILLVMPRAIL